MSPVFVSWIPALMNSLLLRAEPPGALSAAEAAVALSLLYAEASKGMPLPSAAAGDRGHTDGDRQHTDTAAAAAAAAAAAERRAAIAAAVRKALMEPLSRGRDAVFP